MRKHSLAVLSLLGAFSLAQVSSASAQTADAILNNIASAQKSVKDISFRVSGTADQGGGVQKLDLNVQTIPASSLARVVFNAPDALADNIVIVSSQEIRNYLYLTNQITVTSLKKALNGQDLGGLDLSQLSNLVSALKTRYDVKVLGTTGAAPNRIYELEADPKTGVQGGSTHIFVSENGWRPTRFQAIDPKGKVVADLVVSNYKTNSGLSAAKLTQLPKDAEVIKQ
ncbi:outer membrane lipoprotein carrier protein LolA [Deinococcus psychrotolerans]|uniref:Outer membrane lipoprotein carrier protein LolA n=1 Tax=Deinococcus psychrotolerans TaxID=2489213 RepID=A0A3G8YA41_9DEIO|nr:outer membrane lipoprotein carrier protein LolA [Deinococcus psychrotolerans]AZI42239.1 outer membrane lipoprotein carrier protein LolA [Deinococcus psychrotolerans]